MNFFIFFSHQHESNDFPDSSIWKELIESSQLDDISKLSFERPVVIFKHSIRCGISKSVLSRFESKVLKESIDLPLYYLDLLTHRDLSDLISYKFHVTHQSPQLLIISDGKSIKSLSHYDILDIDLKEFEN